MTEKKKNSCARVEGTGKNHDALESAARKTRVASAMCVEETRGAPRERESEDSHASVSREDQETPLVSDARGGARRS